MREIVEAETVSPRMGARTEAALRVDSPNKTCQQNFIHRAAALPVALKKLSGKLPYEDVAKAFGLLQDSNTDKYQGQIES